MPTVPAPPSRHAPGPVEGAQTGAAEGTLRYVMECHVPSWGRSPPRSFARHRSLPVGPRSRTPPLPMEDPLARIMRARPLAPARPRGGGATPTVAPAPACPRLRAGKPGPMSSSRTRSGTLIPTLVDRNRWRSHPHRHPGPRLSPPPSGEAGAQPRSWRQFQRLSLLSTGCGSGASQGWAPARGPGRRLEACVAKSPDRDVCMRSRRRGGPETSYPHIVMPGLVPSISFGAIAAAETDARNKSGHDEGAASGAGTGARRAAAGDPLQCVMNCHVPSCAPPEMSWSVMVRPLLLPPSFAREDQGERGDFARPSVSRMPFLLRVPFHSVPAAAGPAGAGPCFARIACAPARGRGRAFRAGAVRAPNCPRARQAQGAPLPSVPLGSFLHRRKAKRPRGNRFLLLT